MVNGNHRVRGNDNMRGKAQSYFQSLYEEEFDRRPRLDGLQFRMFGETCRIELEREFTEEGSMMDSDDITDTRHQD